MIHVLGALMLFGGHACAVLVSTYTVYAFLKKRPDAAGACTASIALISMLAFTDAQVLSYITKSLPATLLVLEFCVGMCLITCVVIGLPIMFISFYVEGDVNNNKTD